VRDQVFQRDGGRCTFVGADGRRCGATGTLQIDHRIPIAIGGKSSPNNLRVLCARHNRLEAQRLLGRVATRRRSTAKTDAQGIASELFEEHANSWPFSP
jgi:5-methylcytosine-specific restriction endonuclease McrA